MGQKRKMVVAETPPLPLEPPRKRSLLKLLSGGGEASAGHENGDENTNSEVDKARPPRFRNKEKTLILCSRRITYRYRHLMMDMTALLPHSKRDVKVQCKDNKAATLNELADLKGCTSCLLFECRKKKDLYMWISKAPSGPSAKFLVSGVHTMAELKLTGNHLKGSRPILTFSSVFDEQPHLQVLKELLLQVYCTPKDHRKSKPFFDHVLAFSVVDNHIWFRNYQIAPTQYGTDNLNKIDKASLEKMTLIEVGPRFCLNPIKIFSGSFGGQTLYENPFYVSPNLARSLEKKKKAGKYVKKVKAKQRRREHMGANQLEPDELANVWDEEE
ncbi:unnamed protein product [Calypogeia fissa]